MRKTDSCGFPLQKNELFFFHNKYSITENAGIDEKDRYLVRIPRCLFKSIFLNSVSDIHVRVLNHCVECFPRNYICSQNPKY